jgi:CSLREA domain-containing protein
MKRWLIVAAMMAWPTGASAATFLVNTTVDAVDAVPGDGVCATIDGRCSLRAAVQESNALTGAQAISLPAGYYTLTIPGSGGAGVGDLNVGANTQITITGTGPATTIIDANGIGGAFAVDVASGGLTLVGVTVQNGSAGCIATSGGLTLNRVVLQLCQGAGGAIQTTPQGSLTLTIVDTTITGSLPGTSGTLGGGVSIGPGTSATIVRSTIAGNFGHIAGGVYVTSTDSAATSLTIANSTIAQNTGFASGILLDASGPLHSTTAVTLVNVTIAQNASISGGGAIAERATGALPPSLTVSNTIVANNPGGGSTMNCGLLIPITDLGRNLEFPGTTCGFGQTGDLRVDPLLAPLAPHGGPTATMPLLAGSPAIDAGSDVACAMPPVSGQDQRGVSRTVGGIAAWCSNTSTEHRAIAQGLISIIGCNCPQVGMAQPIQMIVSDTTRNGSRALRAASLSRTRYVSAARTGNIAGICSVPSPCATGLVTLSNGMAS